MRLLPEELRREIAKILNREFHSETTRELREQLAIVLARELADKLRDY